ncbi:MAG: hypothetical protein MUC59_14020 [Saprospiraceae bacterium]|nr:hypothetical protein [Saprospiraceae bacterium]
MRCNTVSNYDCPTSPAHPFSAVQPTKTPTHRRSLACPTTCLNPQGSSGAPAAAAASDGRRPRFLARRGFTGCELCSPGRPAK